MKKTLLILGILFLFGAGTAYAGFNFGVKTLSLTNTDYYSNSPMVHSNQILGCYFGVDVGTSVVILAGLDFSHSRVKSQDTPGGYRITDVDEISYTSFTPRAGVRFYLSSRTSGKITPYLEGGIFKTFTSMNYEDAYYTEYYPGYNSFYEELYKELLSPFGFYPAFGVEYYLSDNFSVGGEMGVRFSFGSGEATYGGITTKTNNDFWSSYIGINLNYRFGEKY
jgi:opacity protein-like surface antigen